MSRAEFDRWVEFYRREPFDDQHRYHRPAAMVANGLPPYQGVEIADLLDYLRHDTSVPELSQADKNTMRAFGINRPQRN